MWWWGGWGWGSNGGGSMRNWLIGLLIMAGIFLLFQQIGWGGWWFFFFFFPAMGWFFRGNRGDNEQPTYTETIEEMEKRKNDEEEDAKPKREASREPRYVLGDDGEIVEVYDDAPDAERGRYDEDGRSGARVYRS